MGFFDDLGKKVSDAGQKTIQKTKEMSDTAKFNSMISEEEKKINNNYYQVGKLYVSIHGTECEEDFKGMIAAIRESETKITEYRRQIQEIKGVLHCEKCGAEVPKGVAFCSSCGTPMPQIEGFDTENYEKCGNCGATVAKGMRFCTSCGTPMVKNDSVEEVSTERFCPSCGKKVDADSAFCAECGTKICL